MSNQALDEVTLVLVTYFSASCIEALAPTLLQFKHVIVVDNGSTDQTAALVKTKIPSAKLIELPKNLGFGAANNRALAKVQTEFAAMVNPDVAFDLNAINQLLETAKRNPTAAFVAPQLINKNGDAERDYRWSRYKWASRGAAADGLLCTGFVSGAFILARQQVLQKLNGFDEAFFLYYEDEDLCERVINAGYQIIVDPAARVTHFSRGSVKTKSAFRGEFFRAYHHTRSKFLFDAKHNPKTSSISRKLWLTRLWLQAFIALPLRVLIPSGKYFAYLGRVVGRLWGLFKITFSST